MSSKTRAGLAGAGFGDSGKEGISSQESGPF